MATFELEAARRAVEWHPPELPNGGKEDIRRALHGLARNQPVSYRPPRALDLLRVGTGIPDATFRAGQEEAVRHVVEGRGRLLVVERTGWGKSFVYFIATKLLREAGRGPACWSRLERGHMEFLIEALDGDPGDLGRTAHGPLTTEVEPDVEREALAFLRRLDLPIMPRKQWPSLGGLPRYGVKGRIAEAHRAEEGRARCYWSDGGWGEMVRAGKQEDERFAEKLVEACTSLFREWEPDPRPEWVTCIPSLTNRRLVPDFARRLAAELDLPFREALVKTEKRRPQKTMANSPHQARNVDGSLAPVGTRLPTTPVLLIDDIVGSRWTFTVASWLLRTHGAGAVWPLALASLGVRQ